MFEVGLTLLIEYYSGGEIKKHELGAACGPCVGQKRCIREFRGKT